MTGAGASVSTAAVSGSMAKPGIGGKQAVLGDHQTGDLFLRCDPQADGVLQDGEDDGDDHSHIEDYGSNAQTLDAKEMEATAVKDPLFRGHAGWRRGR